jgi:6-phosphofructokinase 1
MGVNYGAAMISEGVFHSLSDDEVKNSGINFSYDDHGHPELGKISKAHIFSQLVDNTLGKTWLKVKTRPVEIGYDTRCYTPIAFDRVYCSLLGFGVYKLFSEGITGCMVYVNTKGDVAPLYLKDLQDPVTGKIPPRLVDINSQRVQSVIDNMLHYITPADYEAAGKFLQNPEEYDFRKILNW